MCAQLSRQDATTGRDQTSLMSASNYRKIGKNLEAGGSTTQAGVRRHIKVKDWLVIKTFTAQPAAPIADAERLERMCNLSIYN